MAGICSLIIYSYRNNVFFPSSTSGVPARAPRSARKARRQGRPGQRRPRAGASAVFVSASQVSTPVLSLRVWAAMARRHGARATSSRHAFLPTLLLRSPPPCRPRRGPCPTTQTRTQHKASAGTAAQPASARHPPGNSHRPLHTAAVQPERLSPQGCVQSTNQRPGDCHLRGARAWCSGSRGSRSMCWRSAPSTRRQSRGGRRSTRPARHGEGRGQVMW